MRSVRAEAGVSGWKEGIAANLVREKSELVQNHIPRDATSSLWMRWFHFPQRDGWSIVYGVTNPGDRVCVPLAFSFLLLRGAELRQVPNLSTKSECT